MDRLWRGGGLAVDEGVGRAVGLVHGHRHGGSVAVLHDLVVALVSRDHCDKGEAEECLEIQKVSFKFIC